MCGRFYVDDETAREIEKVLRQINSRLEKEQSGSKLMLSAGDIHPTETAPVFLKEQNGISCKMQHWGLLPQNAGATGISNQVIFNARCESALEKPMFKESVRRRRVVIPAAGFYEWNRNQEKNTFFRKDAPVLFMAGCYSRYADGDRFTILTTAANASMEPVHDRMPLILEREEIEKWILNDDSIEAFLRKRPGLLERRTEYEQLRLF